MKLKVRLTEQHFPILVASWPKMQLDRRPSISLFSFSFFLNHSSTTFPSVFVRENLRYWGGKQGAGIKTHSIKNISLKWVLDVHLDKNIDDISCHIYHETSLAFYKPVPHRHSYKHTHYFNFSFCYQLWCWYNTWFPLQIM